MEAVKVIEEDQMNELRNLIDALKTGSEQFEKKQKSLAATYMEIINSLDQTQEDYGETLKFFIKKLQNDMKPVAQVNNSLLELIHAAALFAGKSEQTGRQVDNLSQTLDVLKNDLSNWGSATKEEIKNLHQNEGKNIFRGMKLFIIANTAGTIGLFATMFYFFYKTGIFGIINP